MAVFSLAMAYGMWSLQAWGRRLAAAICMIDLPVEALGLMACEPTAFSLLGVASLFIDAAILIYISRPEIERQYIHEESGDEHEPVAEEKPSVPSL